jgi:hypothetical protein
MCVCFLFTNLDAHACILLYGICRFSGEYSASLVILSSSEPSRTSSKYSNTSTSGNPSSQSSPGMLVGCKFCVRRGRRSWLRRRGSWSWRAHWPRTPEKVFYFDSWFLLQRALVNYGCVMSCVLHRILTLMLLLFYPLPSYGLILSSFSHCR